MVLNFLAAQRIALIHIHIVFFNAHMNPNITNCHVISIISIAIFCVPLSLIYEIANFLLRKAELERKRQKEEEERKKQEAEDKKAAVCSSIFLDMLILMKTT